MSMPKVSETVAGGQEYADGLEIISIGSLCKGPWEKKYWSSSRGKDRYPYPVGYQAVRSHNGITYKIEIHQGFKGPHFVITSADGLSCSGKTPDLAWEETQKKIFPRMKIWNGKRFLCKIDGIEFFGFKNPFVQRLLRELMANINGKAEYNILSSNSSTSSAGEHNKSSPVVGTIEDLMLCPKGSMSAGKRTRRQKIRDVKSDRENVLKDCGLLETTCSSPSSMIKNNQEHLISVSALEEKSENGVSVRSLPAITEPVTSVIDDPPQEMKEGLGSEDYKSPDMVRKSSLEEKPVSAMPLNRLQDDDNIAEILPISEDEGGIASTFYRSEVKNDINHCAPDILGLTQDDSCDSSNLVKNIHEVEEEIAPADPINTEELMTSLNQVEEFGMSNPNVSSAKRDFDCASQDIAVATSMMTVLLPQAIPLLKRSPRKRNSETRISENLHNYLNYEVEDAKPRGETTLSSSEKDTTKISLTPKSFECYTMIDLHLPGVAEPGLPKFERGMCHPENQIGQFQSKRQNESSGNHSESTVFTDFKGCIHEKDACATEFILDHTSQDNEVISVNTEDACKNLDAHVQCISPKMDLKNTHDLLKDTGNANIRGLVENQLQEIVGAGVHLGSRNISSSGGQKLVHTRKKPRNGALVITTQISPLSKNTVCSKLRENITLGTQAAKAAMAVPERTMINACKPAALGSEVITATQFNYLCGENSSKNFIHSRTESGNFNPSVVHTESVICAPKGKHDLHSDPPGLLVEKSEAQSLLISNISSYPPPIINYNNSLFSAKRIEADSEIKQHNKKYNNALYGMFELVGSYSHPMPVSFLFLKRTGDEVNVCVLCGLPKNKDRTLLIYRIKTKEANAGCPSVIGHTPVMLPSIKHKFEREIALEGSGCQLTPDAQYVVLLGSIKTPNCREGKINCNCATCLPLTSGENAVKIVQVGHGFVSIVAYLRTVGIAQCVLVCEPNVLVSANVSGRLQAWVMDSSWRVQIEEFTIQANDSISFSIVELKKVPKCSHLLVGHNGFGEFSLWDISKRVCISSFFASTDSIQEFFPISLFCWRANDPGFSDCSTELEVESFVVANNNWFSMHGDTNSLILPEGKDVAVWLFVSTGSESQHEYVSHVCRTDQLRNWSLALLVKDVLILGVPLDPRAAVVSTSAGYGIIGASDGLVYLWDLSSGVKLGILHHFRGSSVSCIATDDSGESILAIAGGGELLVYQRSIEDGTN